MNIKKGLRNVVMWMGARRKYNNKRHDLAAQMKVAAKAERFADETVALTARLAKKFESELEQVRQECAILRKKAENVAKFASELITSPQDTVERLNEVEHRLMGELKAISSRLGIPAKIRAEGASHTIQ